MCVYLCVCDGCVCVCVLDVCVCVLGGCVCVAVGKRCGGGWGGGVCMCEQA